MAKDLRQAEWEIQQNRLCGEGLSGGDSMANEAAAPETVLLPPPPQLATAEEQGAASEEAARVEAMQV